ncbi:MAG: BatA and WFA domain-containing protein [Chitinophagales bacterium]|nr:BatA and WFA domain-containing protein [Chitinophagales bacterium]
MSFIHPSFLFALLAIAIPIAIHLFNFRRYKKIYFSNIRLLQSIVQETTQQSKLKHLLVLAARCLAFIFIILAFAQPFIPYKNQKSQVGNKAVSIYIDNSQSMNAIGKERSLLEAAKQSAREIVKASSNGVSFQIINNNLQGRQQHLLNADEALQAINETEITAESKGLSDIIKKQKAALDNSDAPNKILYLLSDFQASQVDMVNDTNYQIQFVPFENTNKQNVFIDSCWFESPVHVLNQTAKLLVKIRNSGNNDYDNIRLTLDINNKVKGIEEFSIAAQETKVDTFQYKLTELGWNRTKVSINDFPIVFDDAFYLTYTVLEKVNVLLIQEGQPNKYLKACFSNETFNLDIQSNQSINYKDFGNNNLIILNNITNFTSGLISELAKYSANRGNIAIIPSATCDISNYNQLFAALNADQALSFEKGNMLINKINTEEGLFKNVFNKIEENQDMPSANTFLTFNNSSRSIVEAVLSFKDNRRCISKYNALDHGNVYVFSTPLDINYTTLPNHPIFAPMLYNMALIGNGSGVQAYSISSKSNIEVFMKQSNKEQMLRLVKDKKEIIPSQEPFMSGLKLKIDENIHEAGFYEVKNQDNELQSEVGLNYDRKESELVYYNRESLEAKYMGSNINILGNIGEGIGQVVKEIERGVALWKYCVVLALLMLLIEILLLRFWGKKWDFSMLKMKKST